MTYLFPNLDQNGLYRAAWKELVARLPKKAKPLECINAPKLYTRAVYLYWSFRNEEIYNIGEYIYQTGGLKLLGFTDIAWAYLYKHDQWSLQDFVTSDCWDDDDDLARATAHALAICYYNWQLYNDRCQDLPEDNDSAQRWINEHASTMPPPARAINQISLFD